MLRAEIIVHEEQFKALKSDWDELLLKSRASIFQSWAWCRHWWHLYHKGKKCALVVVRRGNQLVGVVPLSVGRLYPGLPLKVAALMGTGVIDYGGVPTAGVAAPAVIKAALAALSDIEWDVLDIQQLPAPAAADWRSAAAGYRLSKVEQEPTYVVELPTDLEEYRAGLRPKFRKNLDYNQRRLRREHQVEVVKSNPESVAADMEEFYRLHRLRWRQKHLPGALLTAKIKEFHRRAAADMAVAGFLNLSFLVVDGSRVACVYGFTLRDVDYYYLGGFDPDWGRRSVSSLLLYQLIADAVAAGRRRFDFLRGEEDYKRRWSAKPRRNYRLLLERPGLKPGLAKELLLAQNKMVLKAKAWWHSKQ